MPAPERSEREASLGILTEPLAEDYVVSFN
jgi:hypothetical protein